MVTTNSSNNSSLTKNILPCTILFLLLIAFIHICFNYTSSSSISSSLSINYIAIINNTSSSAPISKGNKSTINNISPSPLISQGNKNTINDTSSSPPISQVNKTTINNTSSSPPISQGNKSAINNTYSSPPISQGNKSTVNNTSSPSPISQGNKSTVNNTSSLPPVSQGNKSTINNTFSSPPISQGNKTITNNTSSSPHISEGNKNTINNISSSPPISHGNKTTINNKSSSPHISQGNKSTTNGQISCDYSDGEWVHDKMGPGPLYNGTTCNTIKSGQNCMSHGRPDQDYLYWKWRPKNCKIPRFDPKKFLEIMRNKHVAFVGDSMARNQLESLMCMLSTSSKNELVYNHGDDNKFRKWNFPDFNSNISIYWSPFLVNGTEKQDGDANNKMFLESVDEKWASDLGQMDMVVLSVGHWFLNPAVYYYQDKVLGCHYCPGQNHTEISFYGIFGQAFNTTLNTIIDRKGNKGKELDIFVTTFSPHHFEGDWDKLGACPKTQPYNSSERNVEGMDAEMRKAEILVVDEAKEKAKKFDNLRIESLDVTKLAFLRPDGHPGPYMYPFPFANGVGERVQNDCVHWCLPGPIDTWNEILLHVLMTWHGQAI